MFLSKIFLFAFCVGLSTGYPAKNYDQQAIAERIRAWKSDEKQNIWELSGLFEGDIMRSSSQILNRNGLLNMEMRWPDGVVPLRISEEDFNDEEISVIVGAIKEYHNKTCLRFRPYQKTDKDYVVVQATNSGCWSYVGRQGNIQIVNFQKPNCVRHGVVIHEFMHALGFYHQQSAADRDDYVTIKWNNIINGTEHNFDKYDKFTVTDYGVQYDYGSVMHYSAYAFSKNGKPTIKTLMEGAIIGQRDGLSEKDILKVQLMYKSICESRIDKEDQSYYDISDL